jgi:hypothetical protein
MAHAANKNEKPSQVGNIAGYYYGNFGNVFV